MGLLERGITDNKSLKSPAASMQGYGNILASYEYVLVPNIIK